MNFMKNYRLIILSILVCLCTPAEAKRPQTLDVHKINRCSRILEILANPRLPKDGGGLYAIYPVNDGYEIEVLASLRGAPYHAHLATKKFPHFKRYGYHFRRTSSGEERLRVPSTAKLNDRLDSLKDTVHGKPFRFEDWFPNDSQSQEYEHEKFLEAVRNNRILLATGEQYLLHDRAENHIVAVLLMPNKVFINFKRKVELLFALKDFFKDNQIYKKLYRAEVTGLVGEWDTHTAGIGNSFVGRNEGLLPVHIYREIAFGPANPNWALLNGEDSNSILEHLVWRLKFDKIEVSPEAEKKLKDIVDQYRPIPISDDEILSSIEAQIGDSVDQ